MPWKANKIEKSLLRFRSTVTKKPRSIATYQAQAKKFSFFPDTFLEIPFVGTQFVQYSIELRGNSDTDYKVMARFYDVAFSEKELPRTPVEVTYHKKRSWRSNISMSGSRCAVKCSCFVGDTLIPLANGTSVPIKDLVGLDSFYVYSYDRDLGKNVIAKGYNCELKEEKASLVEVEFDNGYKVKCTLDHKFLLKNGSWVEAKDLLPEMSLQAFNPLLSEATNHKVRSIKFIEETQDVYCFTVEKYGNFLISVDGNAPQSGGVIVHNCPDFRFTWQYELSTKAGSLVGNWQKYDGFPGDPRRNPKHTVGMCKHVWGFLQYLLVTERVIE